MADSEKPQKEGRPESPTTARELDFDDDEPGSHPQTPAKATHDTPASATTKTDSPAPKATSTTAPAQAPKAMTASEQAELTLREAFPSIDGGVVKAVLMASGGQIEPAFNALLGMSDPDAQVEAPPPPQPPRRAAAAVPAVAPGTKAPSKSQLEADELYARQLAEHYQQQDMRRAQREQGGRPQQGGYGQREEERERNFIDDDLPEIGENIKKGFMETQKTFNGWLNTLKKRIDGDEDDDEPPALPARRGPDPRGSSSAARRSNDYDRYDADPEEFDNDFSKLQLRDETASPSGRPGANPNLFKPTPALPSEGRRVSFQDGPPEEIGTPDPTRRPTSTSNKSKWQPLAAADPTPVSDHDPFTVGDSDDEDSKKKETKPSDSDRLEKAMAEATGEDIGSDKKLEPQEKTGPAKTKDKIAEEKLTGGKK